MLRVEDVAIAERRLARRVPALGFAYYASSAALLVLGGLPCWRGAVIALSPLLMLVLKRSLRPLALKKGGADRFFIAMSVKWQLSVGVMIALTGGVHSPMVAGLAMAAVYPSLLLGIHRIGARLAMSTLVIVTVVAAMPHSITGVVITTWHHEVVSVLSFAWVLYLLREMVTVMSEMQRSAAAAIDELREERVREAESHTRSLKAVSARVAHELKNPLAVIKALLQLQARRARDDRERQQHDVMQGEIARMETLLREYLSFARPFEDIEPEPVDLGQIVHDVAKVIACRAEHVGVELALAVDQSPITADARRLKHAVMNLLTNALDATPRGGRVTVTCGPGESGGARLVVIDSGRGIPREDLERIGTSFFTTRAEGTGLGVVTVVRAVAQHGGHVHYVSAPGRGTRVTLDLPAQACALPISVSPLTVGAGESV